MQNTLYYTAGEVQEMLGVSRGKAYKILKELNEQLETKGFIVIAGKIPKKFFNEHYYGLSEEASSQTTQSA
jgi:fructose-1-phosphate kinase PfkB-like protein